MVERWSEFDAKVIARLPSAVVVVRDGDSPALLPVTLDHLSEKSGEGSGV